MNGYATNPVYHKWMWIELIGFDNTVSDFAIGAFLDQAGFIPQAISFLICNPDFVHNHQGMHKERVLPPDCCSYGGHARNEQRSRQSWTNCQFRELVRQLQKHGIAVYLSFFDFVTANQWTSQHPEIRYVLKNGQRPPRLCPWKRLADGSYYEDFLTAQLTRVMQDYGFDGLHGADGYNQPRIPIYNGDFSDDMVDQFLAYAQTELPPRLRGNANDDPHRLTARADYIWQNKRLQYIHFNTDRIQRFWRKMTSAMHTIGKTVFLNSAWTRDPFEAVYRYGTDYCKLAQAGVDGFIIEAAATALETLEQSPTPLRYLCDFMATSLLNSATVSQLPMYWLHGIKDTEENWHALRQAPTALECEIHSMATLYRWDNTGSLQRCYRGLVTCLSDGLSQQDWASLKKSWDLAFAAAPKNPVGITVIWSKEILEPQLADFINTRRWPIQQFLRYLIAMGAPISAVADAADVNVVTGPILAINLHLWPQRQRHSILSYENGPVIAIGHPDSLPQTADHRFEDSLATNELACAVIGRLQEFQPNIHNLPTRAPLPDLNSLIEPPSWLDELCFQTVSDNFLTNCVNAIIAAVPAPRIVKISSGHASKPLRDPRTVALKTITLAPGTFRIIIRNDNYSCVTTRVDTYKPIKNIHWRNPFTAIELEPQNTEFTIKVPPRGIAVIDLENDIAGAPPATSTP